MAGNGAKRPKTPKRAKPAPRKDAPRSREPKARPNRRKKQGRTSTTKPRRTTPPANARQSVELDWNQFAEGKNFDQFEDLAVDIFVAEFGEEHFIPNARRSGKDGGADGLYSSKIGRVSGPWKIACAVRQTFAAAKKKVQEENKLARKAKHRGLFFITSYDATAVEANALAKLAAKGLKGSVVWGRAKLERLLAVHTWLRQLHFGHDLVAGFVPLSHPSVLDDPRQPDLDLVGRDLERQRLSSFIQGNSRIAVLVANGGSGKTRLLRSLPQLLWASRPRRPVWLRRPKQGTIDAAFRSGISIRTPLVIALDDAMQAPSELVELARLATDGGAIDAKLIAAIRAVDLESLRRTLATHATALSIIDLSDLTVAERAKIAALECPGLNASDASQLARVYGSNLFLLRAAAQQLRRGASPATVIDDDDMRRLIATRFLADAERLLADMQGVGETRRTLALSALSVPLPLDNIERDEALAALLNGGLLRRVGNTLRFRNDVEGDILLAYLLEQPAERVPIEKALAQPSDGNELQQRLRNLSAAGKGRAAAIIREIVRRWIAEPLQQRHHNLLRFLPYCAQAAPDEVAELCLAHARESRFDAGELSQIIHAVGRDDSPRGLRLAADLAALELSKSFSIPSITSSLLNPYFHDARELVEAEELLAEWLVGGMRPGLPELIAESLNALFITVARWDTSDEASVTFHERELPATPRLLSIRTEAVRLLGSSAITSKPATCDRLKPGHFARSGTAVDYFELESLGKLAA